MTEFEYHNAGNNEAQQKMALAWMLKQEAAGKAQDGVLAGLLVTQTGSASAAVLIASGGAIAQDAVLSGASLLVNDSSKTLDILTTNPMGATPRNDIVVFDAATITIHNVVGTPNANPQDPTIPASATPLARLRHQANATTVPSSAIDDMRSFGAGMVSGNLESRLAALEYDSGDVTNVLTAATGWSVAAQTSRKQGKLVTITFAITRTGSSISGTSDGNLTNVEMATVATGWRPFQDVAASGASGNAGIMWGGFINESGTMAVGCISPNQSIPNGATLSGSATYIATN